MNNPKIRMALVVSFVIQAAPSLGGELIYTPVNPGFGGFPNNYDYLQNLADIQNGFAESGGGNSGPIIDFPDFNIDLGGGVGGETVAETTDESVTTP